jgi:phage-related protein
LYYDARDVTRCEEAVYVLHAFEKRSRKAPRRDLEIGRERYAQLAAAGASRR